MIEYIYLRASHSDQEIAEQVAEKLETAGYKVWLGQSAGGDDQQQKQSAFAIERSDAFVLGLSPAALEESGVEQELMVAQEADKPIFAARLRPVALPAEWQSKLSSRPLIDLSADLETGLEELLSLLAGQEDAIGEGDLPGAFFGGEGFGRVPALPGEQTVWSESGLYWFKKWKTLVRVLVMMTGQRLIFFWDERDIWKWKPREVEALEEAFPLTLSLEQITAVGEVHRPKALLIFATGKPYVDIQAAGDQLHRFNLQSDFEAHIDALRDRMTADS